MTPPPAPAAAPAAPPLAAAARPAAPGPGTGPRRGRPRLIGIQNSKDVLLSGLNLHNQAVWCLFVLYSENVEIDGVKITAEHNIPSSDGIDIDSSKHVHITNVFIDDDDDCISIKSGKDADGLRVNRPAEDILIENSHFAYGQGGVAMGSETSGGIRNVTVLNCVMDSGNWAPIRFKSQPSRGGVVENITYKNIVAARHAAGLRDEYGVAHGGAERSRIPTPCRWCATSRSSMYRAMCSRLASFTAWRAARSRASRFENCKITADRGFRLEHARNVDLKGLTIEVKQGDPITKTDVE